MSTEVTPLVVTLVGCGKSKVRTDVPVKACDLYTSSLFRMSFQYATLIGDDVQILSAKHGLLSPYEKVHPYEATLDNVHVDSWASTVINDLLEAYAGTTLELICLAGRRYSDAVFSTLTLRGISWGCSTPFGSMNLFERLRWLKEQIDELS